MQRGMVEELYSTFQPFDDCNGRLAEVQWQSCRRSSGRLADAGIVSTCDQRHGEKQDHEHVLWQPATSLRTQRARGSGSVD